MSCYVDVMFSVSSLRQNLSDHRNQSMRTLLLVCALLACANAMSCMSDAGKPVSWFAILKYPNGGSYVYADANAPAFQKSSHSVDSASSGALALTISQVYHGSAGYIIYNDEPSGSKYSAQAMGNLTAPEFGHSKGVVGWNPSAGFWVVHSFPKFPNPVSSGYDGVPDGELIYAQSVLCVSVAQSGLDAIGGQLQLNRPDIYDSKTPAGTTQSLVDAAAGKYVSTGTAQGRKFAAIDGTVFTSFSKTGAWDKALYQDLVAPTLKAPLFVETWIRGSKIPSVCPSTGYGVKNVLTLTFPPHVQFDETNDHSKWAITADKTTQTVCIGGINQMTTQNIRGGGTVCMFQPKTWQSMMGFISSVEECK